MSESDFKSVNTRWHNYVCVTLLITVFSLYNHAITDKEMYVWLLSRCLVMYFSQIYSNIMKLIDLIYIIWHVIVVSIKTALHEYAAFSQVGHVPSHIVFLEQHCNQPITALWHHQWAAVVLFSNDFIYFSNFRLVQSNPILTCIKSLIFTLYGLVLT